MIYLRSLRTQDRALMAGGYPFDLPFVRDLDDLDFPAPVTFFVGENGSGKSTLLEAVAIAARAIAIGGRDLEDDPTLAGVRRL